MFERFFIFFLLSELLAGCSLKTIDAPPITIEDRWVRQATSKVEVRKNLVECGYVRKEWTELIAAKVDSCMLSKGFQFIDSPYGEQGAICIHDEYKNRPSCKSLK